MWLTAAKINLSEQIESGSSHSPFVFYIVPMYLAKTIEGVSKKN